MANFYTINPFCITGAGRIPGASFRHPAEIPMPPFQPAKRLSRLLAGLALLVATPFAIAAPSWQINPTGQGAAGASAVSSVDVGGVGFVQIIPAGLFTPEFTFIEHGAYQLRQADGSPFGSRDITVTYAINGSGNFFDPFALSFTGGSIRIFADPVFDFASPTGNYGADNGTLIGSFSVLNGGLAPTGLVSLQARLDPGSLLAGYLFDAAGNDLSTAANVLLDLGVYNQVTKPTALLVEEIVCGLANYGGNDCLNAPFANSELAYTVADGGTVSLHAVPEPASLGLLLAGLGLIPVGARWRKRT